MAITASLVKELRTKTGAGMMDCKKALQATDGDIDKAIDWLREKGIAKAAKKADRIAAEGLCNVLVKGNEAVVYELNSETDFVAKNTEFNELLTNVGQAILDSEATNLEEALQVELGGKPMDVALADATFKIGEKLSLRRVSRITKTDDQNFGAYAHMGGRIVTLVVLDGADEEAAKDVAMHVAAINPKYKDSSEISESLSSFTFGILKSNNRN